MRFYSKCKDVTGRWWWCDGSTFLFNEKNNRQLFSLSQHIFSLIILPLHLHLQMGAWIYVKKAAVYVLHFWHSSRSPICSFYFSLLCPASVRSLNITTFSICLLIMLAVTICFILFFTLGIARKCLLHTCQHPQTKTCAPNH